METELRRLFCRIGVLEVQLANATAEIQDLKQTLAVRKHIGQDQEFGLLQRFLRCRP